MRFLGGQVTYRRLFFLSVLAVVILLGASAAQALQVFIDEFSIVKNGALFFDDTFNGTAPPTAPNFTNGTPGSYFVQGVFTNAANKVLIDTAQGLLVPSGLSGMFQRFDHALLLTNTDQTNTVSGLKSNHTFSVTGVFNLVVPGPTPEGYGIRLEDSLGVDAGDDVLDLLVQRQSNGSVLISYVAKNLITHTSVFEGGALLDPAHDEIALTLAKLDAGSPFIQGSYAYIDGGVMGATTTFSNTANAFTDETFTRAAFIALSPVPEPSSLLLLGAGLLGIGAVALKRPRG